MRDRGHRRHPGRVGPGPEAVLHHWYGPQNASLAIVGDFDPKVAKGLVEKYFSPVPRGPDVKLTDVPQPAIGRLVKEILEDKLAEVPRLILAWKGVRQYTDEEPAGDVLADVLGSGRTSGCTRRWCSTSSWRRG